MKRYGKGLLFVTVLLVLAGIALVPPDRGPFMGAAYEDWHAVTLPDASPTHELLLIGDTGDPRDAPLEPALRLLQTLRQQAAAPSTTLFLGDNIYPRGILPDGAPGADKARRLLGIQLDAMQGLPGQTVFVPGNHDWNHDRPDGALHLSLQQSLVVGALGADAFPLAPGQPGPLVQRLDSSLVLVLIDTGWFIYRPRVDEPTFEADSEAFFRAIADTVASYADARVVVAAHHPLYSNGQHSGRYPFRSHIFPLIELRSWAFVPLPVLGTLAFAYVARNGLTPQDLGHPRYRALRDGLERAFAGHPDLIYAAAHDHNLQYVPAGRSEARLHTLVSGSGSASKVEELVGGYGIAYGYAHTGVGHLRFYGDEAAFLDFVIPKNGGNEAEVVFRTRLY